MKLKAYKLVSNERGAVEFIESSVVLAIIFVFIGVLFSLTLFTMAKIIQGEEAYNLSIKNYYQGGDFCDKRNRRGVEKLSCTSHNGQLYKRIRFESKGLNSYEFIRINTADFIRKVNFVGDMYCEYSKNNSLKVSFKDYIVNIRKYIENFFERSL